MLLKPVDFCVLIPSLAAVIASFFLAYAGSDNRPSVFLKSENSGWVFPVDANETINTTGPLGTTVIDISGGSARITASHCINQTCVACGPVRRPGQWAACLPNRVMLYIGEGQAAMPGESDVDAATW
jgi:hypothetical protein